MLLGLRRLDSQIVRARRQLLQMIQNRRQKVTKVMKDLIRPYTSIAWRTEFLSPVDIHASKLGYHLGRLQNTASQMSVAESAAKIMSFRSISGNFVSIEILHVIR